MKKYKTFQEAMIENSDEDIYLDESIFRTWNHDQIKSGVKCNIVDYCINERNFINFGNMYCNGDLIYSEISGLVIEVGADVSIKDMNWNDEFGHKRFILRAAALETKLEKPLLQTGEDFEHSKTLNFIRDRLVEVHGEPKNLDYMHKLNNAISFVERMEGPSKLCGSGTGKEEKPKRTKVEWGCVHYSEVVHYFDVAGSDLYYFPSSNAGKCNSLQDYIDNLQDDGDPCLYHRIETEITEREEFVERCIEATDDDHGSESSYYQGWFKCLYDNGCRFVD